METKIKHLKLNRLEYFPIMMFAIVMGLGGLTIVYQKATEWLGFPSLIATSLMYFVLLVFVIIAGFYISKLVLYPKEVVAEWKHPVRINFFSAVSISMLMLAIIYKESFPSISAIFWYPGTLWHFFITLYTLSFWINHNQEIKHSNPAWFIPIVGNLLVPVAGVGFVSNSVLMYFFSIGLFFWIILFSILLNRIIFHHQLPQKFIPTLFILLAPPPVALISYYKLFHVIDIFASFLYSLALFFTFLLAFMYRSFIGIKFFISWWAFIFPLASMSIASMLMYHLEGEIVVLFIAYAMIFITTIMTIVVATRTTQYMLKREICIQE